jgi:hypothetical protein
MSIYNYTVTWTSSATSAALDIITVSPPMALVIPASFGASTITFEAAPTTDGTYAPVYDETGAAISITVNASTAGWYDLTNIFPASVRFVKLVAGSSITQTATLVGRDVD